MVQVVVGEAKEQQIDENAGQRPLSDLAVEVKGKGLATATLSISDTWCSHVGAQVWFGILLSGDTEPAMGGLYTVAAPHQRVPITIERSFEVVGAEKVRAVWRLIGPGQAWTGVNAPPQLRVVLWSRGGGEAPKVAGPPEGAD